MNIAVCCKFVPSVDDLVTHDDQSVSFENAEWKINEFDLHAVEAGVALAKETGGKLIAVTVGDSHVESSKLRKDLLSRGPDEMVVISADELAGADPAVVSELVAKAAEKIGADLILCGAGSEDYYNQQTGLQIGEWLGWATVADVDSIALEGGKLVVDRLLEKKIEVLELPLPAVISVTTSINTPTRPNMRAVLAAGKKPVTVMTPEELEVDAKPAMDIIGVVAPESVDRKQVILSAEDLNVTAAELVRCLKSEGVL